MFLSAKVSFTLRYRRPRTRYPLSCELTIQWLGSLGHNVSVGMSIAVLMLAAIKICNIRGQLAWGEHSSSKGGAPEAPNT